MRTIAVIRKPLEGTVASNTLTHSCGGLNIDATRIHFSGGADRVLAKPGGRPTSKTAEWGFAKAGEEYTIRDEFAFTQGGGRWPWLEVKGRYAANLLRHE